MAASTKEAECRLHFHRDGCREEQRSGIVLSERLRSPAYTQLGMVTILAVAYRASDNLIQAWKNTRGRS